MANLSVGEVTSLALVAIPQAQVTYGYSHIAETPFIAEQTIAISGSSTPSAAFNASTRFIRVFAGAACCIAFGDTPTATTNNAPMGAGQTEYFGVVPGQKIAVIANP